MERAIICPQCNAPLAPHRFARSIVCPYCGTTVHLDEASVSSETFHQALRDWNSPRAHQISSWVSVQDSHWELGPCIAHGDISDVYRGRRARWPTELVLLKVLRDPADRDLFDNEWAALQALQQSEASGADTFTRILPQPVLHGTSTSGSLSGHPVSIFRWAGGFRHTFEAVREAFPSGIPPRASIWIWRRILEVLSFIHASGMVHGAVLPPHLLVQENEHGVRLVGYSCAGPAGGKLLTLPSRFESFYPRSIRLASPLTRQVDLAMSARCVAVLLGGDSQEASASSLPAAVPAPLAAVIRRVARADPNDKAGEDAWRIREELGEVALQCFGPPQFIPIVMPDKGEA